MYINKCIYIYINEQSDTKHMTVRIAASASKAHPGVQNHIRGKFPDAMDDVLGFHVQPSKKGINHEQYILYNGNIMGIFYWENDDVMFTLWRFVT